MYTVEQFFTPTHPEQLQRNIEFYTAMQIVEKHPVLGIGLGGEYEAPIFVRKEGAVEEVKKHFIHNGYLRLALSTGLPGLAAYLFVLWRFMRGKAPDNADKDDAFWRTLRFSVGTAVVASLVISFTKADLVLHPLAAFMGIMLGLPDINAVRGSVNELSGN